MRLALCKNAVQILTMWFSGNMDWRVQEAFLLAEVVSGSFAFPPISRYSWSLDLDPFVVIVSISFDMPWYLRRRMTLCDRYFFVEVQCSYLENHAFDREDTLPFVLSMKLVDTFDQNHVPCNQEEFIRDINTCLLPYSSAPYLQPLPTLTLSSFSTSQQYLPANPGYQNILSTIIMAFSARGGRRSTYGDDVHRSMSGTNNELVLFGRSRGHASSGLARSGSSAGGTQQHGPSTSLAVGRPARGSAAGSRYGQSIPEEDFEAVGERGGIPEQYARTFTNRGMASQQRGHSFRQAIGAPSSGPRMLTGGSSLSRSGTSRADVVVDTHKGKLRVTSDDGESSMEDVMRAEEWARSNGVFPHPGSILHYAKGYIWRVFFTEDNRFIKADALNGCPDDEVRYWVELALWANQTGDLDEWGRTGSVKGSRMVAGGSSREYGGSSMGSRMDGPPMRSFGGGASGSLRHDPSGRQSGASSHHRR